MPALAFLTVNKGNLANLSFSADVMQASADGPGGGDQAGARRADVAQVRPDLALHFEARQQGNASSSTSLSRSNWAPRLR